MSSQPPVIALGLDALEGTLVERLLDEGRMPNLAALREKGVSADIENRPSGFLSMVWPTFISGQTLGAHGWYFNKLWCSADQSLRYVDPSWLPIRVFWEGLDKAFDCALLDIPFSPPPNGTFGGVFLNGWQAHDDFGQHSRPADLARSLRRRCGRPALGPEIFGPQNVRTLERQRQEALASLDQFADVVIEVLSRRRWDLLVGVFGGAHRATHYLWSLDEADLTGADERTLRRLEGARDEIYEAVDRAVGKVLAALPEDARLLVFALHGMGRNKGWAEHFPAMVRQLHTQGEETRAPSEGWIYHLKRSLPWEWIRQVTTRLPSSVNHRLVPLWSRRMYDWSAARFFALPVDLNGYLKVNLKGREAEGIVEPGREYDELLDQLSEEFMTFRDLRDDAPIVRCVDRVDDIVGADAPFRRDLPDLVVQWSDTYAHGSPGVRSCYGELRLDPTGPLPSGRSGNHTRNGWCVASGPGLRRGRLSAPIDSADLPATLLDWMGAERPDWMDGAPVRGFTEPRSEAEDHGPRKPR